MKHNLLMMKLKYFAFVILILAVVGIIFISEYVQQIKEPQHLIFQSTQTEFTDKEILDAVYSDYKVPDGFFVDVLERGEKISDSVYYERVLENNKWVFYCTNDFDAAKQHVEEDINEYNQSDYPDRILIETTENEKFFEFKTIENQTQFPVRKYYLRYRVYKCSYIEDLQHGMYYKKDEAIPQNYIGKFAQRLITIENVKELIEFLWYSGFGNYNIGGSKVLSSFTEDHGGSIKHTIYETRTVYGDWGLCDQITLIKSEYNVDKNSGEITLSQEDVKTVKGRCH